VFHMNVTKVDCDVSYVAMVVYVCCKLQFSMSHLFFSNTCRKCSYLNVAMFTMVFNCFSYVFASVSDACFKCFICLQTYVSNVVGCFLKVDQILHMLQCDPPRWA